MILGEEVSPLLYGLVSSLPGDRRGNAELDSALDKPCCGSPIQRVYVLLRTAGVNLLRQHAAQELFLKVLVQLIVVVGFVGFLRIWPARSASRRSWERSLAACCWARRVWQLSPPSFDKSSVQRPKRSFRALKELGLMLLLFIVGMEFDFSHLRKLGRAVVLISLVGIVLPFGLGVALAPLIHERVHPGVRLSRPDAVPGVRRCRSPRRRSWAAS